MRFGPLGGSVVLCCLIAGLVLRHPHIKPSDLSASLELAAIVLGLGFAFIFDDPAAGFIASAPTPLLFRRAIRLVACTVLVAVVWVAVLIAIWLRTHDPIPIASPTLFLTASLTLVAAVACGAGQATKEGPGGIVGAPLLLLTVGLSRVLPPRFHFFETAGAGYSVGLRLGVVTALCSLAALWASLDPARPVMHVSPKRRSRQDLVPSRTDPLGIRDN